jgi:hypothetical protein
MSRSAGPRDNEPLLLAISGRTSGVRKRIATACPLHHRAVFDQPAPPGFLQFTFCTRRSLRPLPPSPEPCTDYGIRKAMIGETVTRGILPASISRSLDLQEGGMHQSRIIGAFLRSLQAL